MTIFLAIWFGLLNGAAINDLTRHHHKKSVATYYRIGVDYVGGVNSVCPETAQLEVSLKR